jgi:hypothetical protein
MHDSSAVCTHRTCNGSCMPACLSDSPCFHPARSLMVVYLYWQVGRDSRPVMRAAYECFKTGASPDQVRSRRHLTAANGLQHMQLMRVRMACMSCSLRRGEMLRWCSDTHKAMSHTRAVKGHNGTVNSRQAVCVLPLSLWYHSKRVVLWCLHVWWCRSATPLQTTGGTPTFTACCTWACGTRHT